MPACLRAGVSVIDFWDLTLGEMMAILRNYNEEQEDRAREQTAINYNRAVLIADFVALRFNGKPIPSFEEVFPDLPQQRMTEKEKKELEYKQAMFLKEQMEFAAKAHNAKRAATQDGGKG